MTPSRVAVLCCALVLSLAGAASAAEVDGTLACCHRHCGRKCYSPCERTGPVRRFLRRVFLPPCPPACPAPVGVVFVPPPAPCAQPAPAANLGRPVLPAPPAAGPAPVEAPFPSATSSRPKRLTPPTPPVPVRLDRLASRNGG